MMVAVSSQTGWNAEVAWAIAATLGIQVFTAWLIMRPYRIEINTENLSIQYRPFNVGPKKVQWSQVLRIYHAKVDPMGDFMGYGVRIKGWKREGRVIAYAFEEGTYAFFVRQNAPTVAFQITKSEEWNSVLDALELRGISVERIP
jgi:ribosomal protein L24E